MAKTKDMKDEEVPVRRLIARRNRALQRFDGHWRDASRRSCSEEDAEVAYMLASSDDPPNPLEDPPPPPPPPDEDEEETETTRTVAFSIRRSEKRVTKNDGELTVKYRESSTEVMQTTSSDDPIGPFDGPIDPIPPPPDPPEELRRLASDKPHSAHATFLRRRDELCRKFDRHVEHTRAFGKTRQKSLR